MSGLSHTPDETTLRDILLRELRQSKRLKYDLEIYDRAREGTDQHTYKFLVDSLKELLTRERKRKNRDRIARSHGDKFWCGCIQRHPAVDLAPHQEVAVAGRTVRGPDHPVGINLPGSLGRLAQKEFAMISSRKNCKRGNNCQFLHKKRSMSPKGDKPKKKINATCKFWKEGNCTRGDKCRFQHKDIEKPSTPEQLEKLKFRLPRVCAVAAPARQLQPRPSACTDQGGLQLRRWWKFDDHHTPTSMSPLLDLITSVRDEGGAYVITKFSVASVNYGIALRW